MKNATAKRTPESNPLPDRPIRIKRPTHQEKLDTFNEVLPDRLVEKPITPFKRPEIIIPEVADEDTREENSILHDLVGMGMRKVIEFEKLQKDCKEADGPYALKVAKLHRAEKAAEINTLCQVAATLGFCSHDEFAELIH